MKGLVQVTIIMRMILPLIATILFKVDESLFHTWVRSSDSAVPVVPVFRALTTSYFSWFPCSYHSSASLSQFSYYAPFGYGFMSVLLLTFRGFDLAKSVKQMRTISCRCTG